MRDGQTKLMHSDISDWSITFVDTGLESAIGERLRRVLKYLDGDEYFLANYSDVLTDAPLDDIVEQFNESGAAASMMIVPQSSFHCVDVGEAGEVKDIMPVSNLSVWVNGGYFVLSRDIFDHIPPRRRPSRGWLRHPGRPMQVVRLSMRRVLETGRHLQGTGRT